MAEREAEETQLWYEGRRLGLGTEFRLALEDTIERIADQPLRYPRVHGEIRRALLRRFPYGVYYREGSDSVVVLGVIGR
jgi:plasmid stabilization system protein ParE